MDESMNEATTYGEKAGGEKAEVARLHKMLKRAKGPDTRWRKRALEGVRFYFDDQWKKDDKRALEDRGQAAITINRIKPTIKLIHGLVVSQPLDWLAKPVGKNDDDAAESATAALKYVGNLNSTQDTIVNPVYFDCLTYGVGVAMPGFYVRNPDRRSEPVQHRYLDPREVRLDPQSREKDISDARFVIWSRKVDIEEAKALYPKHAERLGEQVGGRDPNLGGDGTDVSKNEGIVGTTPPQSQWDAYGDWNEAYRDDVDKQNEQVIIHELWERVPVEADLMEHRDGWVHVYDPNKPEDMQMAQSPDVVKLYRGTIYKVKYHVFCGPLLLVSEDSPYKHDKLPFVFCFFERDQHGDPVSMIESLKDPQREINHRRSKMLWELSNNQLRISPTALGAMGMDVDQAAEHAQNPGAIWQAEQGQIDYLNRGQLPSQQFELMQDAKSEIQAVSGANDDLMGYDSTSKSGVAKQTQMAQGQMMQRPNEANLRLFHKLLGEMTLALVQQAHTDEWTVRITDEVGRDKFITLNQREVDPMTGQTRILNDIRQAKFEIEIDSMPWTPTLRERAASMVMEMAANEPDPIIRQGLRRIAIQVSDMPEKAKVLDILGQAQEAQQQAQMAAMGPPPGMPPNPEEGMPMVPDGAMPDQMMPPPPGPEMEPGFTLPPQMAG